MSPCGKFENLKSRIKTPSIKTSYTDVGSTLHNQIKSIIKYGNYTLELELFFQQRFPLMSSFFIITVKGHASQLLQTVGSANIIK